MSDTDQKPEGLEAIRKFAEETTGWKVEESLIKSILIEDKSGRGFGRVKIEVGEPLHPGMSDFPGEKVMAIFKSNAYLVITPNRGGIRGMPYLYGLDEIVSLEKYGE
ncbi:MAG TPA: hypothetical protein VMW93_04245 [bacterium]|nr:hypothetical protein [bacterium]